MKKRKGSAKSVRILAILLLLLLLSMVFTPGLVYADDNISGDFTDPNFKQIVWEWLGHPVGSTPGSFTKQNLIDRMSTQNYALNFDRLFKPDSTKVSSLAGLQHFEGTGIKILDCWGNKLTSLPALPGSLEELYCGVNGMTSLPALPDDLKKLVCRVNKLSSLPDLPAGLKELDCGSNSDFQVSFDGLTTLPTLPASLEILDVEFNYGMTSLPELPSGLQQLYCSYVAYTTPLPLPDELPGSLWVLHCASNQLTELPALPDGLKYIECGGNLLSSLPPLPAGLLSLECSSNRLTNLPPLPDSLEYLFCGYNRLGSLPNIPDTLIKNFDCRNNYLNVFSEPLKSAIADCPAAPKSITPQYRYTYPGAGVKLNNDGTYQIIASDLKLQLSSNGIDWTDETNTVTNLDDFTFSSSDASVATTTAGGLITASGNGSCNVYADFAGINTEYTRAIIPVTASGSSSDTTEATTFVLSNEEGGLIDDLIARGYGSSNLYQVLVSLGPSSGGVISEAFLETLANCPAGSEIFTTTLSNFSENYPVCINSDGTISIQPIYGRDYYGKTGYATYPEALVGEGRELFTYATSPEYYINAGQEGTSPDGGTNTTTIYYKAFAIAWSSGVKIAGTATDNSVTMTTGNTGVSADNAWEINITSGTLKGSSGDDLSSDFMLTGLPAGLTWTAKNNGDNKILITVAGTASPAVNTQAADSVVVKGSAVSDAGAVDSESIALYVNPSYNTDISGDFTDPNFKQKVWEWLGHSAGSKPGSFTKQNLIEAMAAHNYTLNISGGPLMYESKTIKSLAGLQHFEGTGLKKLNCNFNKISSISSLPSSLEVFACHVNSLSSLPSLPDGLTELVCSINELSSLPTLPGGLKKLSCLGNQLSNLPTLPDGLIDLDFSGNNLTSLPSLPYGLLNLTCGGNKLTELSDLPEGLKLLDCCYSAGPPVRLNELKELPNSLEIFACQGNEWKALPDLPDTLKELYCDFNYLTSLPETPDGLSTLCCYYNYIDIFSDPLMSKINNCPAPTKLITPQYRYKYPGAGVQLSNGGTNDDSYQVSARNLMLQLSSNGMDWTDDTYTAAHIDDTNLAAYILGQFTFSSSDASVVATTAGGLITAKGAGSCNIYADLKGINSKFTRAIIPVTVKGNQLTGGNSGGGTSSGGSSSNTTTPTVEVKSETVTPPITDINNHWAKDCIAALLQHGEIAGYPDRTIKPDKEITRAEAASLLVSSLGLQNYQLKNKANPYKDKLPSWAERMILIATENGLMKGYPDGSFRPDNTIARAEMCVALMKAFPKQSSTVSTLTFTDKTEIPGWAKDSIEQAIAAKAISGYPDNTFRSSSNITRAEVFSIICKLKGYHAQHNVK